VLDVVLLRCVVKEAYAMTLRELLSQGVGVLGRISVVRIIEGKKIHVYGGDIYGLDGEIEDEVMDREIQNIYGRICGQGENIGPCLVIEII
jgi:hypothetical protein